MPDIRINDMHRPAKSTGATSRPAVELRDQFLHVSALCQIVTMTPVIAGYGIGLSKMSADSCSNSLLTDVEMYRRFHLIEVILIFDLELKQSYPQHRRI